MAGPAGGPALVASAIKQGISRTAGLREYRAAGGAIRTQTWYRLWGEAEEALAGRLDETLAPLDAPPTRAELTPWSTSRSENFATQVEVFVRDRETGLVSTKPYTHFADEPIVRQDAIEAAIEAYGSASAQDRYGEVVMGAVTVGQYETIPLAE